MIYFDDYYKTIMENDKMHYIPEDEYRLLYDANKERITNGEVKLVYSHVLKQVVVEEIMVNVRVMNNGTFYYVHNPDDKYDLQITAAQEKQILKETNEGYVHYIEDGVIVKVKLEEGELFDYDKKTKYRVLDKNMMTKKFHLLSTDLVSLMKNIGVKYVDPTFGEIYYPITPENLILLQIMRTSNSNDRAITLYKLDNNKLDPSSAKIFSGIFVTNDMVEKLINASVKYIALLPNVVQNFKYRLERSTDVEESMNCINNYAKIIINEIEEGGL